MTTLTLIASIATLWFIGFLLGISALAEEVRETGYPNTLPRLAPEWAGWVLFLTIPLFGWFALANGVNER